MQRLSLLFFALLFATFMWSQPTSMTYNSNGTWTVPVGYSAIISVQVWGAGGGGGATGTGEQGGGGGGAFVSRGSMTVPAGTYNVTVGVGGGAGTAGGSSSITLNTTTGQVTLTAAGGAAGTATVGGQGGQASLSTGAIKWSGGNGGASHNGGGGGGGGGSALTTAIGGNGADANGSNGGAGGIGTGNGGKGGTKNGTVAIDGLAPGGGGGGKSSSGPVSKSGAAGRVIITVDQVLPISLLSFSGIANGHHIELTWSTATELNNDYMAVERSADGLQFAEIGRVNGSGTSYNVHNYQFTDAAPVAGINYYRLRQVDIDGVTAYHKIISVEMDELAPGIQVKAYPNPTKDFLSLSWIGQNETTLIRVFDMMGREQLHQVTAAGLTQYSLPVSQLASGTYVLQLQHGNINEVLRFQKN